MTTFEKVARIEDAVEVSTSPVPDGRGAALLFTNLQTEVGGIDGGATVNARLCSVTLPVRDHAADCTVKHHFRGHASVSRGARAVLIARVGGETFVRSLDESSAGELFFEVTSTLRVGSSSYVATVVLVAERDAPTADQHALIVLDSLDLVLVEAIGSRAG